MLLLLWDGIDRYATIPDDPRKITHARMAGWYCIRTLDHSEDPERAADDHAASMEALSSLPA